MNEDERPSLPPPSSQDLATVVDGRGEGRALPPAGGLAAIGPAAVALAEMEGLPAHAESVRRRLT